MRERRQPLRDRKSARFMGVSARSRELVYPAISRNDNHWSNGWGRRAPGRVAVQRAASLSAPIRWRVMTDEMVGVACRNSRIKRPGLRAGQDQSFALGNLGKGIWEIKSAGHDLHRLRERGRRRTRQDQISLGL
jgi:hypothetical protein